MRFPITRRLESHRSHSLYHIINESFLFLQIFYPKRKVNVYKTTKTIFAMLKSYLIREFHAPYLLFIFAILILTLLSIGLIRINATTPTIIDPKLKVEVLISG